MNDIFRSLIKNRKKLALILVCLVMIFTNVKAIAISDEDLKSLYAPWYQLDSECTSNSSSTSTLAGDDNISKIFNFLVSKGLADFQAAGVLGNMWAESGFEPQRAQGIFDRLVPAENWREAKGGGYGLVQWTPGSKMVDPVKAEGKDPNLLEVQLDFLWRQLNGETPSPEKKAGDHLKATTNVVDATLSFETKYERHAGSPQPQRIAKAEEILNQARSGGITTTPSSSSGSGGQVSKVYILGDSITRGAAAKYREVFSSKQISVELSGQDSRSWNVGGLASDGTPGPGKEAIIIDEAKVKASNAVVIALGTNGLEANNPIDSVSAEVKRINPSAKMYWINVAGPRVPGDVSAFNATLNQKAGNNYAVIDWAKAVDPSGNGKNDPNGLLDDGVHPNQAGYTTLVNLVVDQVSSGGTQASAEPACVCSTDASANQPVITLDPGHGGSTIDRDDPETGLHDGDYNNPIETQQVFDVAQVAKALLEGQGYRVILTKEKVTDSVFLRDRANKANAANADMAISIHTQGDRRFGTWQEIYTQKVGLYRGSGSEKQTFNNEQVANKSQEYARAMKEARDTTEVTSGTTVIKDNSFDGRGNNIEPGNIPLVQLWSSVPWIYLEAGGQGDGPGGGLSDQQKFLYAGAIAEGVKKAVPIINPNTDSQGCATANNNTEGLTNTILSYAWPDYRPPPYTEKKEEYKQAVLKAQSEKRYVGGGPQPGVDCGGFVTTVMFDSGFEKRYNYDAKGGPTGTQEKWLQENWEKVGGDGIVESTAELKQGDVAMRPGHTFMYAGDIPGFGSKIASASYSETGSSWRAPMAGKEAITGATWYRKK